MKTIIKTGIICLAISGLTFCQPPSDTSNDESVQVESRVFPVKITPLSKSPITRTLEYTANLAPFKEIHYAPASPGRINKINVDIGSRVKKGQVIVEMDETQLSTALTQLASAEDSYQRMKTLYEQGSMAEQQYEQVKTQYELAQKNVEFLSDNTTLKAPINGIVTGKYFENGEMFSGAPNTQAGKAAVVSLMQINPLKVFVSISQNHYADVKKGMMTEIRTNIMPNKVFEGKISKVHPTINPMTRTFQIEIVIPNKKEELRPGMFANIRINIEEDEALMLPSYAVLKQAGTSTRYIFVYENGKARKINVRLGKRNNDKVEIISDEISEGMQLIIDGQASLLDGSDISLVK